MEQVRFSQAMQPTVITVAGCEVKLFFSMRAASALEARFGKPYLDVVLMMIEAPDEDGKPRPPMAVNDQAVIVAILMQCAGQSIRSEDLTALHMQDFSLLARAAQAEILLKMPEDKKKVLQASARTGTGRRSSAPVARPST